MALTLGHVEVTCCLLMVVKKYNIILLIIELLPLLTWVGDEDSPVKNMMMMSINTGSRRTLTESITRKKK